MPRRLQQGRQQRAGQRLRRRDRPADDQVDGPRRRLLLRGHDDTQAAARYGATAGGGEVPLHRQVGGWKAMWEGEGGGWGRGMTVRKLLLATERRRVEGKFLFIGR